MTPKTKSRHINGLQSPGTGLLSKQLASISETLMNASKRRDTAAKEVASRPASRATTPMSSERTLTSPTPFLQPLVDYPFSSSPSSRSTTIVDDTTSANSNVATAGGSIAEEVTSAGIAELQNERDDLLRSSSTPSPEPAELVSEDEDLQSMFESLSKRSLQFKAKPEPSDVEHEEESLGPIQNKLEKILSPPPERTSTNFTPSKTQRVPPFVVGPISERVKNDMKREAEISHEAEKDTKPDAKIPSEDLPLFIALLFENAGINWEVIQGWTTYLFSSGPSGHEAVRKNIRLIQEAEEEINVVIKQTLEEEAAYQAKNEKNLLPRRLIVSNIAADADVEEVAWFFNEFRYDICDIKMVERDPASRTQTAIIDMYTKDAAKQCSYMVGAIYGLMLQIRLAVEDQ